MLKRWVVLFTVACMVLGIMPAAVGAASAKVVVQLTVGSGVVSINGATSSIQKPYQANGTTLVPLSVITKAFGAGLKLEKNKVITLTYNKTKVMLTIGSKTVLVNGKASAIAVAPTVVNNVTMVPLRVITQAFGAAISTSGKNIIIVGTPAGSSAGEDKGAAGINVDAGKTLVGDSYFNWSMNYPSDLTMSGQTDTGDGIMWSNVSENATVLVKVMDADETYTKDEIRDYMMSLLPEDSVLLERKSVTVNGVLFEKIVSKTRDGWFYEFRTTQQSGRVYLIGAGMKATSREALNKYNSILDSFKLSFDASNKALKDITKVKDGYVYVADLDYGLGMQIPADWHRDREASYPFFGNEEYAFEFVVSSSVAGETLEQWVAKDRAKFEAKYASDYLRNISESTIKIGNGEARVLNMEYTFDKKQWTTSHDVYYMEGNHKYLATFYYPSEKGAEGEAIFKQIASTITILTKYVDANFSEIEDSSDNTATVTKTSKKYDYSITLPETWEGIERDFESNYVEYGMDYGWFSIKVLDRNWSASDFRQAIASYVSQDDEMKRSEAKVRSVTNVTINGLTGFKIIVEVPNPGEDMRPFVETYYVVEKNGTTYVLQSTIHMANDTAANHDPVEKVVQTFTIN
ncbi:stalk domain-containing protein [Paenibacillus aurantiacus]|uniref:Stalk domain-containing protein n=1 Tax=Paenibacillus aurantiacus TaxID=1936118 RepID=A0ABV5KXB5_9BACL